MNKIIAITGPTGAGKSTVAKLLCKKFDKCVRLDIDRVKHFVENGFIYDETKEGQDQWNLCAKNVVDLTKNFTKENYTVVIEGVFYREEWKIVFDNLKIDKKILLLPDKQVTLERDKERDPKFQMGDEGVDEHYQEFTRENYKDFIIVDSSIKKANEVADEIFYKL